MARTRESMTRAKKRKSELLWGPTIEALDNLFSKEEVDRLLISGLQASRAKGNYTRWLEAKANDVKVRETDLVHAQNLIDTMQAAFEGAYTRLVERYPSKEAKLLELLAQVGLVDHADVDDGSETDLTPERVKERLASLIGYDEREADGGDDLYPAQLI